MTGTAAQQRETHEHRACAHRPILFRREMTRGPLRTARAGRRASSRCAALPENVPRARRRRTTSSAFSVSRPRSAYCLTNLGTWPLVSPSMSCQTSTWPSHWAPAPMPIVGIVRARVIAAATGPESPRARWRNNQRVRARAHRRAGAAPWPPCVPAPCSRRADSPTAASTRCGP